jgi:hypothetical protein
VSEPGDVFVPREWAWGWSDRLPIRVIQNKKMSAKSVSATNVVGQLGIAVSVVLLLARRPPFVLAHLSRLVLCPVFQGSKVPRFQQAAPEPTPRAPGHWAPRAGLGWLLLRRYLRCGIPSLLLVLPSHGAPQPSASGVAVASDSSQKYQADVLLFHGCLRRNAPLSELAPLIVDAICLLPCLPCLIPPGIKF